MDESRDVSSSRQRREQRAPRPLRPPAFADLLRRCRIAKGLTQEELAARATVSARTVSYLEQGTIIRPHQETVRLLAEALGLAAEERAAFEQAARTLHAPAPRVVSVHRPPHNLPAPITPLVGRADECASLAALLRREEVRLVTITGLGGIGKTRLGLAVAADLLPHFPDGVFFVSLAAIREPAFIISAIALAIGVREATGQAPRETLLAHLRTKRLLLILDNFEQILPAAAVVVDLLATCPRLKVLVTSRAPLHVQGEHEWSVDPLSLPAAHVADVRAIAQSPAVELFRQRAVAVKRDFRLTTENAGAVATICVALDGLPLAIELAAPRIRSLSPATLLTRLEHRLAILTGGAHDLPARQQTLRRAIDWSYDLLTQGEQQLFRRLGVFVGGWTMEAAEAVCGAEEIAVTVLDGMESLIGKSLVRPVEAIGDIPRFAMLETIREYALEQLARSGETEATLRRHAAYFLAFAEAVEPALVGSVQGSVLTRLEADHDNIRAALRWARDAAEDRIGLRLAAALWPFWNVHSYLHEGREWLEDFLARSAGDDRPDDAATRAKALSGAAMLAHQQGDTAQSAARAAESLAMYRQLGNKRGIAFALNLLGAAAFERNDYDQAAVRYTESLALRREIGDQWGVAGSLNNLGRTARFRGDFAQAAAFYQESEALRREIGDKLGVAIALANQGHMARDQGDRIHAGPLLEKSLALYQEMRDKRGIAIVLNQLAQLAHDAGENQRARTLGEESLALRRTIGDKWGIANSLGTLGEIAYAAGDDAQAQMLYQESLARYSSMQNTLGIVECLERLAQLAAGREEWGDATRFLGAAAALREHIRAPILPIDRPIIAHFIATARAVFGDDPYMAAWEAGQRAPLEQVIAHAIGEARDPAYE